MKYDWFLVKVKPVCLGLVWKWPDFAPAVADDAPGLTVGVSWLRRDTWCVSECDKAQTPFTTSTAAAYIPTKLWIIPRRSCWCVRERMSNSPERTDSIRIESIERNHKRYSHFHHLSYVGGETGACSHTSTKSCLLLNKKHLVTSK